MKIAGFLISLACTVFTYLYFGFLEKGMQNGIKVQEESWNQSTHALGILSKVIDWELPQLDDPREFNRLNVVLWDGQRLELIVEGAGTSRALQLKAKGRLGETLVHPGLDWAYFSYDRNSGLMQFRYKELAKRKEGSRTLGFKKVGANS